MMFKSSYGWSAIRATNCDLAAAAVANRAGQNDAVVVTSFAFGISFQRYYHGAAAWTSVPEVADHTQHRWDLVKEVMTKSEPIHDVLGRIESTLRSGQKVFFVGTLARPDELKPQPLAPAPQTIHGWKFFPTKTIGYDKLSTFSTNTPLAWKTFRRFRTSPSILERI